MKQSNMKTIVFTGFFAALIFLGIQSFRIPMPAAAGTPFLHFGHIFVVLAILCLGPKRSAIAAVLGFVIFDILNGYLHAIPNVLISAVINCLVSGMLFLKLKKMFKENKKKEFYSAVLCAAVYGILNIVIDFCWSAGELVIAGSTISAAIAAELTAIPATMINSCFMIIGVAILYVPVKNAFSRINNA